MCIKQISQYLLSEISGGGQRGKAGLIAPEYLSVPNFKSCFEIKDMGSYREFCMPKERPEACPSDSWEALIKLDSPKSC
ncbi:MAG: hypothetical protein KKE11_01835 [Gammaproteobacteria bacterium]|nr:hypothetical protein [Gammaproteobacteria bacterium]